MGLDDKISNAAEQAGGKVKEKTGETTGDRDLQAEGRGDQARADLKQSGEKVKDAAKGVADSLKGH
ncbi:CsbD family protein [Paenarthrobacter aurescens]|uniref:CsbD family protein n=1 Tax=Paenarthrobacter aurescens TaxID=43663 RepID=A0A4Y3NLJ3_PAEAU|nr:CsbD family protein [Paenarthrobacter aurescens]MDO6145383.1 CsbD family protein [Paenarthrobacter aurescens]MDO6149188.1 CsbD family protein [Paenarthrobacter aurescens]MDO6160432.1 CsbD family protein [Paenarthrobacter aurescens]MDO6164291.1 CsbD family protein [Paenarthrobacter aurescens]GEB19589.1 CsbD family protein [Paenarthrobacter aurescens]